MTSTPSTRSAGSEGAEAPDLEERIVAVLLNGDGDWIARSHVAALTADEQTFRAALRAASPSAPDPDGDWPSYKRGWDDAMKEREERASASDPAPGRWFFHAHGSECEPMCVLERLATGQWRPVAAPDPEGLPSVETIRQALNDYDAFVAFREDEGREVTIKDRHDWAAHWRDRHPEPTDKGEPE